jgi:hypothetical protein
VVGSCEYEMNLLVPQKVRNFLIAECIIRLSRRMLLQRVCICFIHFKASRYFPVVKQFQSLPLSFHPATSKGLPMSAHNTIMCSDVLETP